MIGLKIYKPLQQSFIFDEKGNKSPNPVPNTYEKYSECVKWCNKNRATIEDKGDYYEVVSIPEPAKEKIAEQARAKRDCLLEETDYLLAPDYPISPEDLALIKKYRQDLRDVPQQETFPSEVTWPEKPVIQKL